MTKNRQPNQSDRKIARPNRIASPRGPTEPETHRLPEASPGETSDTVTANIGADARTTDPANEWRAVPVFIIDSDEECGVVTFRRPAIEWSGEVEAVINEESVTLDERRGDLSEVE